MESTFWKVNFWYTRFHNFYLWCQITAVRHTLNSIQYSPVLSLTSRLAYLERSAVKIRANLYAYRFFGSSRNSDCETDGKLTVWRYETHRNRLLTDSVCLLRNCGSDNPQNVEHSLCDRPFLLPSCGFHCLIVNLASCSLILQVNIEDYSDGLRINCVYFAQHHF